MSDVVFPNNHNLDFDRDVIEFPAIVEGRTVTCRITLEEFGREIGNVDPATFEDEFLRRRSEVEKRARALI